MWGLYQESKNIIGNPCRFLITSHWSELCCRQHLVLQMDVKCSVGLSFLKFGAIVAQIKIESYINMEAKENDA